MKSFLLLVVLLSGLAGDARASVTSLAVGGGQAADLPDQHRRARAAVDQVMAMREFRNLSEDENRLLKAIAEWLEGFLGGIVNAIGGLPSWLWWLVVVWMLLTLVAIFAHMVYSLVVLLRGSSAAAPASPGAAGSAGEWLGIGDLEFGSVYAEAQRLLASSDWIGATRYLYVAAILWLDHQGRIAFQRSKTNHDYLGELAEHPTGRAHFAKLTGAFERVVYGGAPATSSSCRTVADALETLRHETAAV